MKEEDKLTYIKHRIGKSNEVFKDGLYLYEGGRWNSCINRLYYAAFHIVSALLTKYDVHVKSHNGLIKQFNLFHTESNIVDIKHIKLFARLHSYRN